MNDPHDWLFCCTTWLWFEEWVALSKACWAHPSLNSSGSRWAFLNDDDTGTNLGAEAVEGLALTLEGVDDVEGRHGLALGVLGVGDGVTDNVLKESS